MPKTALIVVDMVTTYDFPDGDRVAASAERIVEPLAELIARGHREAHEVIYVNDNWGHWHSHRDRLIDDALAGPRGDLVEPIRPNDEAIFILKARHSIFFGTPLDYLLDSEGVEEIVLTGQVTEQCILYSALDAHVRGRSCTVARDCVAHIDDGLAQAALQMMERNMGATICDGADVRLRTG